MIAPLLLPFADDREKTAEPVLEIPLLDDGTGGDALAGDGVYTAAFPPHPANTVVRYRVLLDSKSDTGGSGFLPAYPRPEDPFAWEGYFVDPGLTSKNTIYHLFISKANWTKMETNIAGNRLSPTWNDEVPAVVVSVASLLWSFQVRVWSPAGPPGSCAGTSPSALGVQQGRQEQHGLVAYRQHGGVCDTHSAQDPYEVDR